MPKPELLDQVRDAILVKHYSMRTKEAYVHWIKRFIIFHKKRHPLHMGEHEVSTFLSHPLFVRVQTDPERDKMVLKESERLKGSALFYP